MCEGFYKGLFSQKFLATLYLIQHHNDLREIYLCMGCVLWMGTKKKN